MLRCIVEQLTSLFETVAGVKEVVDLHAVLRLLLDLIEIAMIGVAMIGVEWVITFFVGPAVRREQSHWRCFPRRAAAAIIANGACF